MTVLLNVSRAAGEGALARPALHGRQPPWTATQMWCNCGGPSECRIVSGALLTLISGIMDSRQRKPSNVGGAPRVRSSSRYTTCSNDTEQAFLRLESRDSYSVGSSLRGVLRQVYKRRLFPSLTTVPSITSYPAKLGFATPGSSLIPVGHRFVFAPHETRVAILGDHHDEGVGQSASEAVGGAVAGAYPSGALLGGPLPL